jgi:hypothetical protein
VPDPGMQGKKDAEDLCEVLQGVRWCWLEVSSMGMDGWGQELDPRLFICTTGCNNSNKWVFRMKYLAIPDHMSDNNFPYMFHPQIVTRLNNISHKEVFLGHIYPF